MENKIIFYYVYILLSEKDSKFYIGFTEDLKKRLKQHNNGESFATKCRRPFELIFYEAYRNKYDALRRENILNQARGKQLLKVCFGSIWRRRMNNLNSPRDRSSI